MKAGPDRERIAAIVARAVARRLELPEASIDRDASLHRLGLESLHATELARELTAELKQPIAPTIFWEHTSISALVAHCCGERPARAPTLDAGPGRTAACEPIAVIGMACRFPGAPGIQAFWRLLRDGVSAIGEVPRDRWDIDAYHDVDGTRPGKTVQRHGGFLGDVTGFDAAFFDISPREATLMDPQQRLLLELAWEALEDANVPPRSLRDTQTGVFVGSIWVDYETWLRASGPIDADLYTSSGLHRSILANRISYVLGLRGPSLAIDSACSSGLVALHLACESLRNGESSVAIAGAASLSLIPDSLVEVSKFGALSPDGRCYTFDARANGYVRGEGAGVVVLKPLSQAEAAGDPIYCVIRGGAMNNDGASNGLTAPSPEAQEAVLRAAYQRAGVDPHAVQYVEAHGTGTRLGDPIEAKALGGVLGRRGPEEPPLLIGSVKTNIGHLEGAAGMAGFIKVVLSIQHRVIPASLNFDEPNPLIPMADLGIDVPRAPTPWPGERATAGVSSFGFGGTNCHLVVQEWRPRRSSLLVLSAEDEVSLREAAERALAQIAEPHVSVPPLCDRFASRASGPRRLAATARSSTALAAQLRAFCRGEHALGLATGTAVTGTSGPVFVFSGQGKQRAGMGRELLETEPVFRSAIERCDVVVRDLLGWSVAAELRADRSRSRLDDVGVVLPTLVSLEVALVALWESWGVRPAAVVGYSFGEIAAAQAAGILSVEDAVTVACHEARLVRCTAGKGAMALVALPWDEAAELACTCEGELLPAIQASHDETVIAGDPEALDEMVRKVCERQLFGKRVDMDVAPHSHCVRHLGEELAESISMIRPRRARVTFVSTLDGRTIQAEECGPAYWARNFVQPLRFADALDEIIGRGHDLFLEIGPHPLVRRSIETELRRAGKKGLVLASMHAQQDDRATMLEALGALFVRGAQPRWRAVQFDPRRPAPEVGPRAQATEPRAMVYGEPAVLVPISARTEPALTAALERWRETLDGDALTASATEIAASAALGRSHQEVRVAIVADSRGSLIDRVRAAVAGEATRGVARGSACGAPPRVAFVFSGQGSQWRGMGRELYRDEPVFREAIEACDAELRPHQDWSLIDALLRGGSAPLDRSDGIQTTIFAVEVALAALWRSWGVEPEAVVGASMGEVVAAHVAGALTLREAAIVICRRSELMRELTGQGAVVLTDLTVGEAQEWIDGREHELAIAGCNGPRSTVLAGDLLPMSELVSLLLTHGVFCRRVKMDVASHSPQVQRLLPRLAVGLSTLQPRAGAIPIYSTVTGTIVRGEAMTAEHWTRNLRNPVFLDRAIGALVEDDHDTFLEVSPHPILGPSLQPLVERGSRTRRRRVLASVRREQPERSSLLDSLAELYVAGQPIAWRRLFPERNRHVSLPSTQWERERYWFAPTRRSRSEAIGSESIGATVLRSSIQPETTFRQSTISAASPSWVADHRVGGQVVLPGAAHMEMVLAAGRAELGSDCVLEDVSFERELVVPEGGAVTVQLVLQGGSPSGSRSFQVSSLAAEGGATWVRHAAGRLRAMDAGEELGTGEPLDQVAERCRERVEVDDFYRDAERRGLSYGGPFRALAQISRGAGEALARARGSTRDLSFDVGLLDACLHASLAATDADPSGVLHVPVHIERVLLGPPPRAEIMIHARRRPGGSADSPVFELTIFDTGGSRLAVVQGLTLRRLARERRDDTQAKLVLWTDWRAQPREPSPGGKKPTRPSRWLLIDDGYDELTGRTEEALRSRGAEVLRSGSGEISHRLAGLVREPLQGVVYLHGGADVLDRGVETVPARCLDACSALVRLVQAIAEREDRDRPSLHIVTRRGQAINGDDDAPIVTGAPLWGLGAVVAYEHPELRCRRIDLADASPDSARELVEELLARDREEMVALRGSKRHVLRLVRHAGSGAAPSEGVEARQLVIRSDASYLVTGGLGGLGLRLARDLVDRGARRLLLLGRHAPHTVEQLDAIDALTRMGTEVTCLSANVANRDEVAAALAEARRSSHPLRGVVHAAGILDDGPLAGQDEARLARVFSPKVAGAWNLHLLTADEPLDFFILYSSVSSLLGNPGQGTYAAANAFLDALAHHRRARGLPALSINWGPFSEAGMAARSDLLERLAQRGLRSVTPDQGLALAARVDRGAAQVGIVDLDARQWTESYPRAGVSRLLSELMVTHDPTASDDSSRVEAGRAVAMAPPEERQEIMERFLREQVGQVARLEPARVKRDAPLKSLGLDSLMGLELRNRLEAALGVTLPATMVFTHPTVGHLAEHLVSRLCPPDPVARAASPLDAERDSRADPTALAEDQTLSVLESQLDDIERRL